MCFCMSDIIMTWICFNVWHCFVSHFLVCSFALLLCDILWVVWHKFCDIVSCLILYDLWHLFSIYVYLLCDMSGDSYAIQNTMIVWSGIWSFVKKVQFSLCDLCDMSYVTFCVVWHWYSVSFLTTQYSDCLIKCSSSVSLCGL